MKKKLGNLTRLTFLVVLPLLILSVSCREKPSRTGMQLAALRDYEAQKRNRNVIVIDTDYGEIVILLMTEAAKNTCREFTNLVQRGYYDGLAFHYVSPGDMIQGGDINSRDDDPSNDGAGDPGFTIPLEANLQNVRGSVGLAHPVNEPDQGNSQFYILLNNKPELDGRYTVFAQVVEGLNVVDNISRVEAGADGHPAKKVTIKRIFIEERFI